MKLKSYLILLFVVLGCTPEIKEIEYGFDACAFCKMTIVNKQYAAQMVTKKGRVFKYDAIECMLDQMIREKNAEEIALKYTNCFDQPGKLFEATELTYLISKNLPSPMGAYLTAFSDLNQAKTIQAEKSGKIYTWTELLAHRKGPDENSIE